MIAGIGIDAVAISRIDRLLELRGERFLKKVFSAAEIEEGMKRHDRAAFFAVRFAAREAFVKALGSGFGRVVSMHDVEVTKGELGAPRLRPSRRLAELLASRGIAGWHLSLTHEEDVALAVVVLEGS
jgi:holo-[acyl-carrier protein] synthase